MSMSTTLQEQSVYIDGALLSVETTISSKAFLDAIDEFIRAHREISRRLQEILAPRTVVVANFIK